MRHIKAGLSFFISIILVITLTINMFVAASPTVNFSDVPNNHWAKATIEWGVNQGIVQGDGDHRFRPNDKVNQAEFIALIIRAFPNDFQVEKTTGAWYEPYYAIAKKYGWQFEAINPSLVPFSRGDAALLIYNALEQEQASVQTAVNYLLSEGLATGKTANTFEGFKSSDSLTRAEALTFIYRTYHYVHDTRSGKLVDGSGQASKPDTAKAIYSWTLNGIKLNTSVKDLEAQLGNPSRVLRTFYQYDWYVYNIDGKHLRYAVADNKVVGFYSNSLNVYEGGKYQIGVNTRLGVTGKAQNQERSNTYYTNQDGYSIILYFDTHTEKEFLDAISVLDDKYSVYSSKNKDAAAVYSDMELGIFDIANAYRQKHGRNVLEWSEQAQQSAYLHSKDMKEKDYFAHSSLDNRSPFERMEEQGISFRMAGENIAYGYTDDIDVMNGWINSFGHRENLLEEGYTHLGVGVYNAYYTQNFYTPW